MAQNADVFSVEAVTELDPIVGALLQSCLITNTFHIIQEDDTYSLPKEGKRVTNGICADTERLGDGRQDESRGRREKRGGQERAGERRVRKVEAGKREASKLKQYSRDSSERERWRELMWYGLECPFRQ